jgi:DNA-binding CsgD family transcriptional regulator/tetratricopeptide (TPR) repeat protein
VIISNLGARENGDLKHGRESFRLRAWMDAYTSLSCADRVAPLAADDLDLLATSAYLVGRDEEYLKILERAHHAHLAAGNCPQAVRCAFWLGLQLVLRRQTGPSTGWLARAQRLLEREERDCVEQGYLLLPSVLQHLEAGDLEAASAGAKKAGEFGERFAEAELIAAAQLLQGRVLLRRGQVDSGLALLDEAMVTVQADELSPVITGLIYCSVIDGCQQVYAVGRAREWTAALAEWCDEQAELVFTGVCLVHRAQIMQLNGAWRDAIEEARRASERLSHKVDQQAAAAAFYQEAEIHRLRGDFGSAEDAYQRARQWGWEPQPGLALLRLAQGRTEAASIAIRRVLTTATDPLQRTRHLPAYVEIMLAVNDIEAARGAANELMETAKSFGTGVLEAIALHARGAVALAEDDAQAALGPLRRAFEGWQQAAAPYLAARVRVQIGLACHALGDDDGARLELDAARCVFEQLGAAPDLGRLQSHASGGSAPSRPHGLTRRELQVLRSLAAGKTNKVIGKELFISEKTVDRHVSNIFSKLDTSSRAAATAYAYKHRLL